MGYGIGYGNGRSLQQKGFQLSVPLSSTGTNYPFIQLWNPATSGVVAEIQSVALISSSALTIIGIASAALLTGTAYSGVNRYVGGAVSKASYVTGQAASFPANPWFIAANTSQVFQLIQPDGDLVLPPGSGIVFYSATQASGMNSVITWNEYVP
jgi:hypothetical protein